jgi:hypothetical protein
MQLQELEQKLNIEIPEEVKKDLKKAIEFYKKFHWGEEIKEIQKIKIEVPKTIISLGHLVGLIYLSSKEGKKDLYVHIFKPPFPILGASKEKKDNLWILGGFYKIEKEGIIK